MSSVEGTLRDDCGFVRAMADGKCQSRADSKHQAIAEWSSLGAVNRLLLAPFTPLA
jgi:hypothetical protein